MATPTEKQRPTGLLTEQNIFLKQRKHFGKRPVLFEDGTPTCLQHLRAFQLQQELEQLQERERKAQQRNRQLLQQFEQAQSALDEMLVCNTSMKAIRMEYERYLAVSAPRWIQQFKEKTKVVQKEQRMEKHCMSHQEEAKYPVPNLTADDPFLSQVRLSSSHSESNRSSRGPTLSTKGKREKRGRAELSSSDINSEESSRTSDAPVTESELQDPSSDKSSFRKTQRSESLTSASPRSDKKAEERTEKKSERQNEENQRSEEESGSSSERSMQEKEGKQSHIDGSGSCRQDELEKDEKQGSDSWEQRNTEEAIQTNPNGREEKRQKSQKDSSVEDDEDSSGKTTTEEEVGTSGEEEDGDEEVGTSREEEYGEEEVGTSREEEYGEEEVGTAAEEEDGDEVGTSGEKEDGDKEAGTAGAEDQEIQVSSSSHDKDEEEIENSEKNKKESKSDEGKTDSYDSIISPQNKRYKEKKTQAVHVTTEEHVPQSSVQMQTALETASKDEEEYPGSSNENAIESSDGKDVENVLTPLDRNQKDASHVSGVTEDRQKAEQRDSDEFDPFYD